MKDKRITILALLALAGLSQAAPEPKKPVYRDAETHDLLVRKLRVNQKIDPMKALAPSEGEDPSKKNQPQNLIASSDVISFNGLTTLVPKRAIMKVPAYYEDRVNNHAPGNRVVGWLEFYTLNRGWITTVEVSRLQAEGKEPLAEDLTENLGKIRNMIVATYSTGPISMLPPKEKEEAETAENQTKP